MTETDAAPVLLEVWSDLGCPFCYIGSHRLQLALDARPDAARFEVAIRSFELDPRADRVAEPVAQMFVRRHGGDIPRFLQMEGQVAAMARAEGLEYVEDRPTANTFDVHRLHHLAQECGLGTAFFTFVQTEYFSGRLDPFDTAALTGAAVSVGLPEERVVEVLAGSEYADAVRADEAQASEYGATGVPFVVYDGRFATAGAQDVAGFARALDQLLPLASNSDSTTTGRQA